MRGLEWLTEYGEPAEYEVRLLWYGRLLRDGTMFTIHYWRPRP